MSDAIKHLQDGLEALPLPGGWSHRQTTSRSAEFFAKVRGQQLEIDQHGDFVSLAFGPTLWEDMSLKTIEDADRVLAACDAILGGQYSERRRGNWLWQSITFKLDLSSRGFAESWTDVNVGLFGRGLGLSAFSNKSS